jgi:phosphoglycolate phosphatase
MLGMPPHAPTVGFDLDMTLIDSREGIRATYEALSAETGVFIDAPLTVTRLGPPLEEELAHWFPAARVPEMADRYRALYPSLAPARTTLLPGARDALEAVRRHGGRTVVVTAKYGPNAEMHLAHLGVEPDAVVGRLWAEEKARALRDHGAWAYVGDHTGDMRGARAAGALAVAVPTGPCDAAALRAAGADVVLEGGLPGFPAWLERELAGEDRAG